MEITYLGHSSFKIKTKTATVITDPFDPKMVGLKFPTNQSEIVTISHHHKDHDYLENIEGIKKIVDGPGEYEISEVSIIGFSTFHDDKKGKDRGKNTIYVIESEGLRLLHLGDLGHKLEEGTVKAVGSIDILMIPVGGTYTINKDTAAEVVKQIGASIIIPMHFRQEGMDPELADNLDTVDNFTKDLGMKVETLPKLSIKKESLSSEEGSVIILEKK